MSVTQNQPTVIFNKLIGIGVLLLGSAGLIASLALASSAGDPLVEVEAPPPTKLGFEIVQLGEFRRDQFLVDKDSGHVWQSVCSGQVVDGDCKGMMVWDEMCVGGITPETSIKGVLCQIEETK